MKNKTFDVKDYILYILNFDSLVFNEDRHLNNIIFLYDLDKDTYYPAPLFDCGLSLMFDIKDYPTVTPLTVNLRRVANRARPFSSNFKKQEKAITEIKGKLLINSLININLNIDDLYEYYFDKYIDRVKRILKERFPNITF